MELEREIEATIADFNFNDMPARRTAKRIMQLIKEAGLMPVETSDYKIKSLLLLVFKTCFTGLTMTDSDFRNEYLDGMSQEFLDIADKEGIELPCYQCDDGWITEEGGKKYSSCPRCNPHPADLE